MIALIGETHIIFACNSRLNLFYTGNLTDRENLFICQAAEKQI